MTPNDPPKPAGATLDSIASFLMQFAVEPTNCAHCGKAFYVQPIPAHDWSCGCDDSSAILAQRQG